VLVAGGVEPPEAVNKTTKILASILSKGQSTRLMSGQLPYKLFLILKRYLLTCAERSRSIIPLFLAFFIGMCEKHDPLKIRNLLINFLDFVYEDSKAKRLRSGREGHVKPKS